MLLIHPMFFVFTSISGIYVCMYTHVCVYVCFGELSLHDTKLHVVRSADFV